MLGVVAFYYDVTEAHMLQHRQKLISQYFQKSVVCA